LKIDFVVSIVFGQFASEVYDTITKSCFNEDYFENITENTKIT
jgi:hypothetical protein